MNRTKKLIFSLGVALLVTMPLLSAMPQFGGRASAAPINNATYADESRSYVMMLAVSGCLLTSALHGDGTQGQGGWWGYMTADDAVNYRWFGTAVTGFPGKTTHFKTAMGYLDNSGTIDGWNYCNETDWLSSALSFWGVDNPIDLLCSMGFQRSTGQDCRTGSGNLDLPNMDSNQHSTPTGRQVAAGGFRKYINNLYYGNATSSIPARSDPAKYVFYSQSFLTLCDVSPYPQGDNLSNKDVQSSANPYLYRMTGSDGTTQVTYKSSTKKHGDTVIIADNADGSLNNTSCSTLAQAASSFASAYASGDQSKQGGIDDGTGNTINDTNNGGIDTSCGGFIDTSSVGGFLTSPLRWLACPIIQGFSAAAGVLDNGINSMLCINEAQIFDTSATTSCSGGSNAQTVQAYKTAWNVFRIIALGLLAIAGLIMVLSQTMGLEFIDAYTIKRVLPRLVIAAIGVTLSWQLMEFFVALTNLLGLGMRGLIYAPFVHANIDTVTLGGGGSAVAVLTTGGALALLGPLGLLSLVATGLLAILVAFVVLVLRNIVVVLLILTAPIAIVAYVLPNTQKVWAFWWDAFTKALMMFPIITAFIAAGRVFAAISTTQAANLSGVAALISHIVGFIAYFAPYFLIPLTLRFAGGALGTLGGFANDRSRGAFDRLKKYRANKAASNFSRMQQGNLFRGGNEKNFRGRLNRGFQVGTNASVETLGVNPANWKSRMRSTLATQEFDHAMEGSEKDVAFRSISPDDDLLSAGKGARDEAEVRRRLYKNGQGRTGQHLDDSVARVMAARRSMGGQAFDIAAAVGLAGTKTGYAGEYDDDGNLVGKTANEQMMESIAEVAGNDKVLASRMLGATRPQAGRAGRLDLAGHGFGMGVGQLYSTIDRNMNDPTIGGQATNDAMNIDTFLNNDAVTIGRSDSRAVRNIMDSVGRRVVSLDDQINNPGTDAATRAQAQDELGRLSAGLRNMQDQGFYFAPQRIQTIAKAARRTVSEREPVEEAVRRTGIPTNNPGAGGLPTGAGGGVDSYLEQRPDGPEGRRGRQSPDDPNMGGNDRDNPST